MNELLIFLGTALCLSCSFGKIMIWYVRSSLLKTREVLNIIYTASEEMVEIFRMINTYKPKKFQRIIQKIMEIERLRNSGFYSLISFSISSTSSATDFTSSFISLVAF